MHLILIMTTCDGRLGTQKPCIRWAELIFVFGPIPNHYTSALYQSKARHEH